MMLLVPRLEFRSPFRIRTWTILFNYFPHRMSSVHLIGKKVFSIIPAKLNECMMGWAWNLPLASLLHTRFYYSIKLLNIVIRAYVKSVKHDFHATKLLLCFKLMIKFNLKLASSSNWRTSNVLETRKKTQKLKWDKSQLSKPVNPTAKKSPCKSFCQTLK